MAAALARKYGHRQASEAHQSGCQCPRQHGQKAQTRGKQTLSIDSSSGCITVAEDELPTSRAVMRSKPKFGPLIVDAMRQSETKRRQGDEL